MDLAISTSLVEPDGGRIWAYGDGGRSATPHFTLPAVPPETIADGDYSCPIDRLVFYVAT